jgi:hypothetical protein
MALFPRFRGQVVASRSLLPLVADFSGVRSVAADKLDVPWRQMGYQLVYELEALEGLGFALVEPLGGCGPGYRIRIRIVLDFLGTGGTTDNILSNVPTDTRPLYLPCLTASFRFLY